MFSHYAKDIKTGFVVKGKYLDACVDVLKEHDLIDDYFPATADSVGDRGLRFLYYRDLYFVSKEVDVAISDFLEIGCESDCLVHLKEYPDVLTTCGMSDRHILEALDSMPDDFVSRFIDYIIILTGEPWNSYGPYNIKDMLSPNIRARVMFNLKESYSEIPALFYGMDENETKAYLSRLDETYIFEHEDMLNMAFYLNSTPRWLFAIPQDVSFWGYKPTSETLYDMLKLARRNIQDEILQAMGF